MAGRQHPVSFRGFRDQLARIVRCNIFYLAANPGRFYNQIKNYFRLDTDLRGINLEDIP